MAGCPWMQTFLKPSAFLVFFIKWDNDSPCLLLSLVSLFGGWDFFHLQMRVLIYTHKYKYEYKYKALVFLVYLTGILSTHCVRSLATVLKYPAEGKLITLQEWWAFDSLWPRATRSTLWMSNLVGLLARKNTYHEQPSTRECKKGFTVICGRD